MPGIIQIHEDSLKKKDANKLRRDILPFQYAPENFRSSRVTWRVMSDTIEKKKKIRLSSCPSSGFPPFFFSLPTDGNMVAFGLFFLIRLSTSVSFLFFISFFLRWMLFLYLFYFSIFILLPVCFILHFSFLIFHFFFSIVFLFLFYPFFSSWFSLLNFD